MTKNKLKNNNNNNE